jgi:hypothetical protein
MQYIKRGELIGRLIDRRIENIVYGSKSKGDTIERLKHYISDGLFFGFDTGMGYCMFENHELESEWNDSVELHMQVRISQDA